MPTGLLSAVTDMAVQQTSHSPQRRGVGAEVGSMLIAGWCMSALASYRSCETQVCSKAIRKCVHRVEMQLLRWWFGLCWHVMGQD